MNPVPAALEETSSRTLGRGALAAALQASRADTLATYKAYERALPGLAVPLRAELNPPLWALEHVGWFQEWWLARNPQRALGAAADPEAARADGVRRGADALYNSSAVPHDSRWALPLPDAPATQADLASQLACTLTLLAEVPQDDDDALHFLRLALFHEDMHHEAALYIAQMLGVPIADPHWQPAPLPPPAEDLSLPGGPMRLGHTGAGFAFDNDLGVDDQCLHALPGLRTAPLPRLFRALVRRPAGAARRFFRDPAAFAQSTLPQLLPGRSQRYLRRPAQLRGLKASAAPGAFRPGPA